MPTGRSYVHAVSLADVQGGMAASLITTYVLAVIATHSSVILVRCKNLLRKEGVVTFSDIGRETWGLPMARLIDGTLLFMQVCCCRLRIVLMVTRLGSVWCMLSFLLTHSIRRFQLPC